MEQKLCSNHEHLRLILETQQFKCMVCGKELFRRPAEKCQSHGVYLCRDCRPKQAAAQ